MNRRILFAAALASLPAALAAQTAAPAQPAPKPIAKADVSAKLEADYADLDADKDGKVSTAEIKQRLKKGAEADLALLTKERDSAFTRLDANGDGSISRAEFEAKATLPKIGEPDPAPVLARFDGNKDGQITKDEFRAPTLSNFDRMDANKDGTLSLTEQAAAAKKPAPKQTPAIRR